MSKIRHDEIKMHSRMYFVFGYVFTVLGFVASVVTSVFLVSLMRFSLKTHGPMGQYRFEQIMSSFSWWVPLVAIGCLTLGVFLLNRFDFSYKHNKWLIILGFIFAIILAGVLINATGLDNIWLRHGPMRGMMHNFVQDQR